MKMELVRSHPARLRQSARLLVNSSKWKESNVPESRRAVIRRLSIIGGHLNQATLGLVFFFLIFFFSLDKQMSGCR